MRKKSVAGTRCSRERNSAEYTGCCLTYELDRTVTCVCKKSAINKFPYYEPQKKKEISSISFTKTLLHLHSNVDIQTCCDGFQQCLAAALKQERLCKFHPERKVCDVLDHLPGGLRPVKQRLKLLREKGQLKFSLHHTSSGKAHVKYFSLITDVISGYKFPNSRELRGDTIGWLRNKWVHFLCNYKCRLL